MLELLATMLIVLVPFEPHPRKKALRPKSAINTQIDTGNLVFTAAFSLAASSAMNGREL
jgi:hypothetical protein